MTGHESILLRRELKRQLDAEALIFSYRSEIGQKSFEARKLRYAGMVITTKVCFSEIIGIFPVVSMVN